MGKQNSTDQTLWIRLELGLTVLLMLQLSEGLTLIQPLDKFVSVGSYIIVPCLLFKPMLTKLERCLYVATRDIPMLLLILLAAGSLLWSYDSQATVINVRALLRTTLFGLYLATRYNLKELGQLLAWTLGLAALISLGRTLVLPGSAITPDGSWKGAFPHKNYLARTMAISGIVFFGMTCTGWRRTIKWAGFFLSVGLLILSKGKTALVLLAIGLTFWPLCKSLQQKHYKLQAFLMMFALFFSGLVAILVIGNLETIVVDGLGKDLTLTGRTQLWEELFKKVAEQPWLGYGYFGFWSSQQQDLLNKVQHGWVPTHAHSGFLELTLFVGIVGLVLFILSFITVYFKAIKLISSTKTSDFYWPFQFLTIMFLSNLTVGLTIISPTNLMWALYVAVSLALALRSNWSRKPSFETQPQLQSF